MDLINFTDDELGSPMMQVERVVICYCTVCVLVEGVQRPTVLTYNCNSHKKLASFDSGCYAANLGKGVQMKILLDGAVMCEQDEENCCRSRRSLSRDLHG